MANGVDQQYFLLFGQKLTLTKWLFLSCSIVHSIQFCQQLTHLHRSTPLMLRWLPIVNNGADVTIRRLRDEHKRRTPIEK